MSMAWVAVGTAVVGAAGSYASSKAASSANKASTAFSQQQYTEGKAYLTSNLEGADAAFDNAVATLTGTGGNGSTTIASFGCGNCSCAALATAYDATAYDMKAAMATAYEVELDGFISAFKEAEDVNTLSMDTFNRRYGQIMDNVQRSILDVSQSRLSSQGREQLAIDASTLAATFDNQLVKRGMDRTGISVDMHKRMAMETSQQARAIDVNSYDQANTLQAQGTSTLNSMTAIREGIASRDEIIAQNKAQGLLSASMQDASLATQVSMQNANNLTLESQVNATNKTNVSVANATNRTNVSMTNATNSTNQSISAAQIASAKTLALAQLYSNKYTGATSAMNSFYSGASQGVTSAYNQTAASASADAAGYAKAAGAGVSELYKQYNSASGVQLW